MSVSHTSDQLPPGTQYINNPQETHILLVPQPTPDPNQPLNWSKGRKTLHMTILSLYAMMVFAILCVAVPFWQNFTTELNMDYHLLNEGYAMNMAGLAVGSILFVPIALRVGRRPVYIATALGMLAAAVWQAEMYTIGDMFGINILAGVAGSVNEALFQVTVSDLFFVHQRGTMNGLYLIMVMIGNYLGPVVGGQAATTTGWRWVFWICAIIMGIMSVLMIFCLEESKYTPVALTGRNMTLSIPDTELEKPNSTYKPSNRDALGRDGRAVTTNQGRFIEIDNSIPVRSYWQRHALWSLDRQATIEVRNHSFWKQFFVPFQVLATFPAVMFAALQYGWLIAMLAILAITQSTLYSVPPYSFSAAAIGNMNLPPFIGTILGSAFGGLLVDYFIVRIARNRKGVYEPETRLWLFFIPGLSMVVGCLMYGLTIAKGMPWIVSAVGAGFIGFSIGGCGDIVLTYVQDSYQLIIGPALIGVVFIRNIIATGLVFAVTPWIDRMGVHDMFILLACVATAMALTCVPLIVWGRQWREQLAYKYSHFVN